jgi:L-aspartate oxidase
MNDMKIKKTDALIIGSGVAGLRAAIELSRFSDVLIISKDAISEGSTEYAQGGVAVALSDEDTISIHRDDTLYAGDGLCVEGAVDVLVEEGPGRIIELIYWGTQFDRDGSKLAFTREAAHTKSRILHAHGDSTGREIQRSLMARAKSSDRIEFWDYTFTVDLIVRSGQCCGAYVLRGRDKNEEIAIQAKLVILATGGLGRIYERTTNPPVSTGDGIAVAFRAGAEIMDMEFIQFHPTTLQLSKERGFLLSESMRGEGGILRNINGERFMSNYHKMEEMAPRDIVCRAIVAEMSKTKSDFVYLDLTHFKPDYLKARFPKVYAKCLEYNLDMTKDMIPVEPSAHYLMGGVRTDLYGKTSLTRLFACGEVACTGVHGANRLASNSLLEGIVFGARCGLSAVKYIMDKDYPDFAIESPFNKATDIDSGDIKRSTDIMRKELWKDVGIVRCGRSLTRAKEIFKDLMRNTQSIYKDWSSLELRNMVVVGDIIIESALLRTESRGGHYRTDFPDKDDTRWLKHTILYQKEGILNSFYI